MTYKGRRHVERLDRTYGEANSIAMWLKLTTPWVLLVTGAIFGARKAGLFRFFWQYACDGVRDLPTLLSEISAWLEGGDNTLFPVGGIRNPAFQPPVEIPQCGRKDLVSSHERAAKLLNKQTEPGTPSEPPCQKELAEMAAEGLYKPAVQKAILDEFAEARKHALADAVLDYADDVLDENHPDRLRSSIPSKAGVGSSTFGPMVRFAKDRVSSLKRTQAAVEGYLTDHIVGEKVPVKEHQCDAKSFMCLLVVGCLVAVILYYLFKKSDKKEYEARRKVFIPKSDDDQDALLELLGEDILHVGRGTRGDIEYVTFDFEGNVNRVDFKKGRVLKDVMGDVDVSDLGARVKPAVQAAGPKYVPRGKRHETADVVHLSNQVVDRYRKDVVEILDKTGHHVSCGFRIPDGFCVPGHLELGEYVAKNATISEIFVNDGSLPYAGDSQEMADNVLVVESAKIRNPRSVVLQARQPSASEAVFLVGMISGEPVLETGRTVGCSQVGYKHNVVTHPGDSGALVVSRTDFRVLGYHNASLGAYNEYMSMPDFRDGPERTTV
jgi:cbb3-type cytochrome oxidase subunit 3